MHNGLSDRQQAIKLRLAGQSVDDTRPCGGAARDASTACKQRNYVAAEQRLFQF